MDTLALIIRGDQFGLCHASNQAILEGFEAGLLTCASLAVTGPWVAEAVALAHDHPEWEIGLQLLLHCDTVGCRWGPVAGAALVPSLVEPTGTFPPRLAVTATAEDIGRELDAQVDRARAWGISPAFLEYDGAASPAVDAALARLSERLGVPTRMADWGIQLIPGGDERGSILEVLTALQPGVYLWVVQPAHAAPETWALWPGEEQARRRQADARAVCNPEILALIERRGLELISFRQHVETRVGTEAEKE